MISGGASYVRSPPAFSNDGKKLLICAGNTVAVFSTLTGIQMSSLQGHTSLVTSVLVSSIEASTKFICFCWTSSLDGTIRYWDFSVPESMKTIDIRFPIFSMVIPTTIGQTGDNKEKLPDLFAYISVEVAQSQQEDSKGLHGQILKCNLTHACLDRGVILTETKKPQCMAISSSRKFFGITNKRKVHIWEVPVKDARGIVPRKMKLHHTKSFTALAFHPTERIVAAGDVSGRILIWRGFGNKTFTISDGFTAASVLKNENDRPGVTGDDDADSCTTWHWHATGVKVLYFSQDGAYLYSGGKEGVLVIWQLETGKQKFLPRIGSPLLYYTDSPDPALSCISCADNRIHLLKMPSMQIMKSIAGIKLPCSIPEIYEGLCGRFAFDHSAGLVAIRTENYRVQLYSLFDCCEISEVHVCQRNHQPGDDVTVVVSLVAISMDGSMMGTVDTKLSEDGIGGLVSLKFWESGSLKKEFSLSTIVYEPHRDAVISAIAFHPTRHMAVTSSYGGDFKIWVRNHGIQSGEMLHNSSWTCHSVGSYKKKPMTAAAFSADGSVLAVAAKKVITLWDPYQNVLVAIMGETLAPIVSLSFVGKSEYLVSASQGSTPQLSVWDTSKLSVSWSYKLHAEAVACTVDALAFAVLVLLPNSSKHIESNEKTSQVTDGVILLFNVRDPVPVATWSVNKAKGGGLAFLQVDPSSFQENSSDGKSPSILLSCINGDHEYAVFDPYGKTTPEFSFARKKNLVGSEETGGAVGYASIFGELPKFEMKKSETPWTQFIPSERPWETIFSGSSHNLPPLTKLCSAFLESLLEKRTPIVE